MRLKKTPHCLNCGAEIHDANFCPACGQSNTDRKMTLFQFIKDFLDDYFTFDSKFFNSVGPLVAKPGHLTREYLTGRRVRYILPMRLYLFTTFLFFFVVTVNSQLIKKESEKNAPQSILTIQESVTDLLDRNADTVPDTLRTQIIDAMKTRQQRAQEELARDSHLEFHTDGLSDDSKFERYFKKRADYIQSKGDEAESLFFKQMVNHIPKIMFLLLPYFALLLKLLYIRKKIYYVEHLIFSLHFHTFIFLYLIITVLFPKWYVIIPILLIMLIHLFRSMKTVYQQSFWKTMLKFFLLINLYVWATIPAFVILVLLTVVTI